MKSFLGRILCRIGIHDWSKVMMFITAPHIDPVPPVLCCSRCMKMKPLSEPPEKASHNPDPYYDDGSLF